MGTFIVIEGLDGAGTTTQAAALAAWLRSAGHAVTETREPTDGPVGRVIRATLSEAPDAPAMQTLPWLFAADRADHLARVVDPALEAGHVVVSDRYYHSSLAYQSLTLPLDRVHALNADFRVPDLTVFLHVDVDTALGRVTARSEAREIYERRDRLEAIAEAYDRVLARLRALGEPIVTVDGRAAASDVADAVRGAVQAVL